MFGCFYNLGVLLVGVLIVRALLLFGVYDRAPDFWKLPFGPVVVAAVVDPKGSQGRRKKVWNKANLDNPMTFGLCPTQRLHVPNA